MPIKFVRRVVRVGGSYRVAIPPSVVVAIGLKINDNVEISLTAEEDAILIRPCVPLKAP